MYSTVEDLLLWNQALSSGELLPKDLREQIFKPGMNDWSFGWFVTRIPQGKPGAGSTLAEMRGDMPGNFFAWIIRYQETDRVVIVLRNSYASSERFEEKLQAVLFDQRPSRPSRSLKDLVAHACQAAYQSLAAHRFISGLTLVFLIAVFSGMGNRGRLKVRSIFKFANS